MNGREVSGYDTDRYPTDFSVKLKVRVEILDDHLFEWNLEMPQARELGRISFREITKVALKESKFGKDSVMVSLHTQPTHLDPYDATVTYKRKNAADLYEALQDALTRYANE